MRLLHLERKQKSRTLQNRRVVWGQFTSYHRRQPAPVHTLGEGGGAGAGGSLAGVEPSIIPRRPSLATFSPPRIAILELDELSSKETSLSQPCHCWFGTQSHFRVRQSLPEKKTPVPAPQPHATNMLGPSRLARLATATVTATRAAAAAQNFSTSARRLADAPLPAKRPVGAFRSGYAHSLFSIFLFLPAPSVPVHTSSSVFRRRRDGMGNNARQWELAEFSSRELSKSSDLPMGSGQIPILGARQVRIARQWSPNHALILRAIEVW